MAAFEARDAGGRRGLFRAILAGGLTAGLLDIVFAIVSNGAKGVPAPTVLQAIASGLAGPSAYRGGAGAAAAGALLHFAMALLMAAVFVAAARRLPILIRHTLAAGLLYGLALYLLMHLAVVPLSRFPGGSLPLDLWGLAAHLFLVGLPIAFANRRWAPRPV
jgi:hypothetical protein